ncbi:MAG TPA: FHA domain-containing serine/threonine-protein kinase, partial [Planctomycetota bacterium]|nr:FHA domain-containing serine/threonine-protein kinase [Planctomycetota bacterium]
MTRLEVLRGARAGESFAVGAGGVTIGRDAKLAGVVIDDPAVATVHCRVAPVKGGGFGVQDLGTDGGTFVNDRRVKAARLAHGDRIRVGGVELSFQDAESVTPRPAAAASARPAPADDAIGREIGGYRIERLLGRGGMGSVYRAIQTSLHRPVALKILAAELARDRTFVDLFLREARAAAQLHHPNVVTIFDVGSEGDRFYYSMEILEGGSVEERVRREGKLPLPEALAIARDAAAALEFAESRKLVHRDVKPDNLMLTAGGTAKLADLGLASHAETEAKTAERLGTPHFVAPEQARGGPVDHRADLYALGATLFRLVTGRTPFQASTVAGILEAKRTTDPPALRSIDPSVPEAIDALVASLMKRDPAERPASSRAVIDAIDSVLAPPRRVSRIAIAAGALGVLAAGGAVAFVALRSPEAAQTKPVYVRDTTTEERLRRERDEQASQVAETRAEAAFLQVKADVELAPLARADAYDGVARAHAGTHASERAAAEAKRLRAEETARVEGERQRALVAADYRRTLEDRLRSALDGGHLADALALPAGVSGVEAARDDPEARAAIDAVPARVAAAAETLARDAQDRAKKHAEAGSFDAASSELHRAAGALAGLTGEPYDSLARKLSESIATLDRERAEAASRGAAAERRDVHRA